MDEQTKEKIKIALSITTVILLLMLIGTLTTGTTKTQTTIQNTNIIDLIYEQCQEETQINITTNKTLKGKTTTLEMKNGQCNIKTTR